MAELRERVVNVTIDMAPLNEALRNLGEASKAVEEALSNLKITYGEDEVNEEEEN